MSKIQPRTTIDNLQLEAHQRYAQDQQILDPRFTIDPSSITPHAELAGTSSIYSSQLDDLIQSSIGIVTWGSFQPPSGFMTQTNRFFRSRLFGKAKQRLYQDDEQGNFEGSSEEEKDPDHEEQNSLVRLLERAASRHKPFMHHIERDKKLLISLLRKIAEIDAYLTFVNTRRLQYQKG